MPLPIDLAHIARQAQIHADDYDAFRYYVELDERPDAALDAWINQIAAPIIEAIDCTQCANCCNTLDVYLTPQDAEHLAHGIHIPLEQIQTQYIDHPHAQAVEEWGMFASKPCTFLRDKRCQVYAHRPQSCRDYPAFTPNFRWHLESIWQGIGLCPIIYHLVEQLKKELNW